MNSKFLYGLQIAGSILTLVGVILQLNDLDFSKYIFGVGALSLIVIYFINNFQAKDESNRLRRQYRILLLASFLLAVSTYMMFKDNGSWIVLVLIYAAVSVFLSFRRVEKKE